MAHTIRLKYLGTPLARIGPCQPVPEGDELGEVSLGREKKRKEQPLRKKCVCKGERNRERYGCKKDPGVFEMTNLQSVVSIICVLLTSLACHTRDFERGFFSQSLGTRVERLRQLPLEQQVQGVSIWQRCYSPTLDGSGRSNCRTRSSGRALPTKELSADRGDIAVRDILLIFVRMYHLRTYDVKSDDVLMKTLISRVDEMRDKDWQAICQKNLVAMRPFETQPR